MVIVDTDVLVDVFRRHAPAVEWMAKTVAENEVVLPGYVVMELIQGCRNTEEQEKPRKTIERRHRDYRRTYRTAGSGYGVTASYMQ